MENIKIGACGLACFKCPKFKKEECPGCQPNEFCPLPKCAQDNKAESCFECSEFPCQKNYQDGPISHELLDHWKK